MILKINLFETNGKITIRKIKKMNADDVKPKFKYFVDNWGYEKIYDKHFWNDRLMGTGRQQVYLFNTENNRLHHYDDKIIYDMLAGIAKAFIRDLKIKQILR
jgi:uncharacterized protein YutD